MILSSAARLGRFTLRFSRRPKSLALEIDYEKHVFYSFVFFCFYNCGCDDISVTTSTGDMHLPAHPHHHLRREHYAIGERACMLFIGEDELVLKDEMVLSMVKNNSRKLLLVQPSGYVY